MKHLFIPYELAVISKEKGFDEMCLAYYNELGNNNENGPFGKPNISEITNIYGGYQTDLKSKLTAAPLSQQIIDWFREKHGIHIKIELEAGKSNYYWGEINYFSKKTGLSCKTHTDYYSALNAAITEAFKLIP